MIEQLSVFLENRPGTLEEATRKLATAGINIRTLSMADTADFGILRLIVDNVELAEKTLKESGFAVSRTPVIAVEVADRAGGMADILLPIKKAGVNIEYLYAFVEKSGQNAVIIFRFDDHLKASKVLEEKGIAMVQGEKIYRM